MLVKAFKLEFEQKIFGMVVLGSDVCIEGWSDGSLWNGWSKPLFEFDSAERILNTLIKVHNTLNEPFWAWYDKEKDSFYFILEDGAEPECYSAETIKVSGRRELKVYPIGAGGWMWEEVLSE